jgi:putative hydrolase
MAERLMTRRMVTALADPNLDILGHCTGRMRTRKRNRPESTFDAEIVFAAAARFEKAIEVNSRPERLDPPKRLLRLALEAGCRVAIDSDAHYPGQLAWLPYGCDRAAACGVQAGSVINALGAEDLLAWAAAHGED